MTTTLFSPLPFKESADSPFGAGGEFVFSPLAFSLSSPFGIRSNHDDFALKDGALCLDSFLAEVGDGNDSNFENGSLFGMLDKGVQPLPVPSRHARRQTSYPFVLPGVHLRAPAPRDRTEFPMGRPV